MSPRRRSSHKRGWPRNLYERKGYYSWRHPKTGEEFGIGRDKHAAFTQAVEANVHLAQLTDKPRLIHRLTGEGTRTVAAWNTRYQELLGKQEFLPRTHEQNRSTGRRMVRMLGDETPLSSVTALTITGVLDAVVKEGYERTAQRLRAFMQDSFREAKVQGWYVGDNPVADTKLKATVTVKRARLSLEVFRQIYDSDIPTWLRNAMALGLVAGQRREDVVTAEFKDFHEGFWWLEQASQKGNFLHRLKIPTSLRLDAFGLSIEDVLSQCRRSGALSKYLVHQTGRHGRSLPGLPINAGTLARTLAASVRGLRLDWGGKTPPTFHEVRSLSERLYAAQGGVNTQALLGHSNAETTALYHDSRGHDWTTVGVR